MNTLLVTVALGTGATATMDAWGLLRKSLWGIAPPNYGLVGRWIAHMRHRRFHHDAIASAQTMPREQWIGWLAHYLIGIAFAALLIAIFGEQWLQNPTLTPALMVGIGTVAAPFLLMQPGMGAGIAASRTPNPARARIQSLVNHAVFGLGLYATAWLLQILI